MKEGGPMPKVYPNRTVLAQRIRDRRLTFEEFTEQLEVFARENNEVGMLGLRHIQRLAAGQFAPDQLRPATVRLLERFWNSPIEVLLAPPTTAPTHDDERSPVSAGRRSTASTSVRMFLAMSRAFQAADRQVGSGVLYPTVVRYLNAEVAPRLLDTNGANSAAIFAAASSLTEIAGWMAHDTGADVKARQHFDKAFRLASAAGDDALAGNVCASLSHLAGQLGQHEDAVRIAEAGLTRADRTAGTVRLAARLHAMRARGLSLRGDARGCTVALDDAERTLDTVADEQPAEWIAHFDAASLAAEAARCFRQLGRLAQAEQQAHRVIELCSGDRVRSRAFGQLTLARVLVDAGRHDEAATVGREVCAVAPSLTSARVRARLDRLGDILATRRGSPDVAAFLEDLRSLRSHDEPRSDDAASWPV
jgi:tetratricopeptide (TPR) repeat protein